MTSYTPKLKEDVKMKKIFSGLLVAALLLYLTACGSNSVAKYETMAAGAMVEEAAPMAPAMMTDNSASFKGAANQSPTLPEGRKWIITIDMNVETDDLDALITDLDQTITGLGGYVENQSMHNGSTYAARRYRSASLTVRIPEEKADQFTGDLSGMANVVSRNLRREDITLQYVATSGRVTALETEEARLLELLSQAETMADLLEIEARLTDVRYELENYASQLRIYDNQIDYATIYLYIDEVQEYTPVEEPSFLERIKTTFADALDGLGDGVVNITVFLIGNSPYLLVFGILIFVVIKVAKKPVKIRIFKKKKKEEQK
jgi:hypothetical protein